MKHCAVINAKDFQRRLLVRKEKFKEGNKKAMPTPTCLDKGKHRKDKPENSKFVLQGTAGTEGIREEVHSFWKHVRILLVRVCACVRMYTKIINNQSKREYNVKYRQIWVKVCHVLFLFL